MYFTPCFEAIHVVPQKKQTMDSANNAFAFVPRLRICNGSAIFFKADLLSILVCLIPVLSFISFNA
jgi:hypothetical protein